MPVLLRNAVASDGPFMAQMLLAAAHWRADAPSVAVSEIHGRPELAHYVLGWPRPSDLGVIAEDGVPIGAAWLRLFTEDDPGYGFVGAQIPEVSMAVVAGRRGQGIGASLLAALVVAAREKEIAALSLSVEPDNVAGRLYSRVGFRPVGTNGGSITMLLRLA